jgi:hypothetical protein
LQASEPARVLLIHPSSTTTKKTHMNIFNQATKVGTMLLLGFVLHTTVATAQSDEVEYQDAPSSIGEDNDDRIRKQQEEDERNRSHNYSSPNGGTVERSSDDDGANPPDPQGDPGAPIDGGLSVLLAAGAAYGVKRMRKPPTPKGE